MLSRFSVTQVARKVIQVPRRSDRHGARDRRSRAGSRVRRPRRVLVVTNGEVTEKQYCDLLNQEEAKKERGERSFHIECKCNRVDPKRLAEYALKIVEKDKRESMSAKGGRSDPYSLVYVMVDVDEIKATNLHDAQTICSENGMRLVISNPCVEVWLVDHVKTCPPSVTTARSAEELAKSLGLTTGRGNKFIVTERLRGRTGDAVRNAASHNGKAAARKRASLQDIDFAPWTDFPDLMKDVTASCK